MSEKRRKLRLRFRDIALQQLDQIRPAIAELAAGSQSPDAVRTIGRALHTLKGDASLVGLPTISEALHHAEDVAEAGGWAQLSDALAGAIRDLQRMTEDGLVPTPAAAPTPAPQGAAATGIAAPVQAPAVPATTAAAGAAAPAPLAAASTASAAPGAAPASASPGTAKLPSIPTPRSLNPTPAPAPAAGSGPRVAGTAPLAAGTAQMAAVTPPPAAPSAPAAPAAPAQHAAPEPVARQRWVNLQTEVLDDLSERLLELSTAYGRLAMRLGQAVREAPTSTLRAAVDEADAARRQLDDVVGAAWALRLVSVEDALRGLATHASEIAQSQGKLLRVIVDGGRAELERSTIDAIEQPLIHLVRNAVDHGIEEPSARGDKPPEATLALIARTAGGAVEIIVEDDGRGIDPEVVRAAAVERGLLRADEAAALSEAATFDLLFLFGFSTRRYTTALSGRGIGLDAVRGKVESLGGEVRMTSRVGHGTRFVLSVPAAIARERAVVAECGGGVFALPSRAIVALVRLGEHPRREVAGGVAIEHGGGWAPLRALDDVLGLGGAGVALDDGKTPAIVVDAQDRRYVFAVERILGEHDLLRRPADSLVGQAGVVTASSVLDDGRVALWPAIPALIRGLRTRVRIPMGAPAERQRRRVLVVEDSPIVRELVVSILRTAEFDTVAAGDGEEALGALSRGLPDLIISDVEMPRVDGFELLRRVREQWPRLPMVMLTTRGSEEDRRRAATLGADAYLIKAEFEQGRLVDTVRRLIGDIA